MDSMKESKVRGVKSGFAAIGIWIMVTFAGAASGQSDIEVVEQWFLDFAQLSLEYATLNGQLVEARIGRFPNPVRYSQTNLPNEVFLHFDTVWQNTTALQTRYAEELEEPLARFLASREPAEFSLVSALAAASQSLNFIRAAVYPVMIGLEMTEEEWDRLYFQYDTFNNFAFLWRNQYWIEMTIR